ncbi:unnamed protein product [Pleuronectes platessa]|uniref:Uncharacterized protein n=1 Tax=Pleuronectes platessa TaxID=8262 RepID=A0A9N7V3E2_PLEPL|nr:unnamed protein product [Pleuronectes platessa]
MEELDFVEGIQRDFDCLIQQEVEIRIKDGMQEEIEEEIVDETEEISFQRVSKKMPKTIYAEEVEEETEEEIVDETEQKIQEVIEEELYSPNFEEFQESSSSDGLHRDLQKDKAAKAALEEKLRITRAETEMKEAQRRKRKENHALSKASKKEQVEKDQTAHLRQSEKDQEHRYAKLQKQISKMTADLKEKDELVEKFKDELKGNFEVIFQGQKTIKELKQKYEDLYKMKRKSLEQENEIKSLHISIETLQNSSEAKSNTISMLQERVDQWPSGLKEERAKHHKLQRDYEAALSQQQRDKEELIHLTCENQQLALEQKRPQGEPKDDHKRQRAQDNQSTAKFKQEQGKNNKLQKDLEVALSKQHKDKEELMLLSGKNQKLALELKRLRG